MTKEAKNTAEEYAKCIKIDLDKKLFPIHQSVDDMLTRLEEFETLLTIVQQERCNAMGLTGSLSEAVDSIDDLKELCDRIDALEKLMEHVKNNVDAAEKKVDAVEEEFGLTESSVKIKNLLIPFFKRTASAPANPSISELQIFSTEDYFFKESNTSNDKQL